LPQQYEKIRQGKLANHSHTLIKDAIKGVLETYAYAITP
jgi:tagatose-1,6-bisphosphate aldolase non-catalytic subunit AgaZ/GatZ